jgi:tellurite methyltransferase
MTQKETWDERYAAGRYASEEPHRLLVECVGKAPPAKALDLACGTGRHALFLAKNGWQVTAVDNSAVGVEVARARASEKGLEIVFSVADLENGEFTIEPDTYDLICDFYYLQRDLFPPMKRGLRPGGVIISTIHIHGEGEEREGFLLKEGELRAFFADLEILHYHETQITDPDAGDHHHRTAEIVARRI